MNALARWYDSLSPRAGLVAVCAVVLAALVGWAGYSFLLFEPDEAGGTVEATAPGTEAAEAPAPGAAGADAPETAASPAPVTGAAGEGALEAAGAVAPETAVAAADAPGMDASAPASEGAGAPAEDGDVASFDVVQVAPSGSVVVAGRAEPGETVRLLADGEAVAEETADARGEFVLVPEERLEPGVRELALAVETPEGERTAGNRSIVTVPERSPSGAPVDPDEPAVSVLVAPDGRPLRVLQGPESEGPGEPVQDGALVLETITHGGEGDVTITGRAEPGSQVTVYVEEDAAETAAVDEEGDWRVDTDTIQDPGTYELRIDQAAPEGTVTARITATFVHAGAMAPASKVVMVHPGQSLWRISREVYGRGVLYTLIYDSNSYQIADPDLIYPGQLFIVPEEG